MDDLRVVPWRRGSVEPGVLHRQGGGHAEPHGAWRQDHARPGQRPGDERHQQPREAPPIRRSRGGRERFSPRSLGSGLSRRARHHRPGNALQVQATSRSWAAHRGNDSPVPPPGLAGSVSGSGHLRCSSRWHGPSASSSAQSSRSNQPTLWGDPGLVSRDNMVLQRSTWSAWSWANRPTEHEQRVRSDRSAVRGQLVSDLRASYVEPAPCLDQPLAHERRRAVVLVLGDQHPWPRLDHGAGARIQSTSQVSGPGFLHVCGELPGKVIASPLLSVSGPCCSTTSMVPEST